MQAEQGVAPSPTRQVVVRLSTIEELLAHGGKLFEAHFQEVSQLTGEARLRPDWGRLKQLERTRSAIVVCAWAGHELVGYALTLVSPSLHCSDLVLAQNDAIYVAPAFRGGSVGGELIRATESTAAARGAKRIAWHTTPGKSLALEAKLPRLGYEVEAVVWARRIG